jgi:hypothetical protein
MASQEKSKTCWYTIIGKCLDLVVPLTPSHDYGLKEKKKD